MADELPSGAYRDAINDLAAKAWATGETQHFPFLGLTVIPDVIAVEQAINGDEWEASGRWIVSNEEGRTAYVYTDPLDVKT